jgi:thymidylate kinase
MQALRDSGHTKFVSFSGIDGAGKSTQIEALCARMKEDGLRVALIRFWDDVAKLTRIRETTGHVVFRGDKGVGTVCAPINRRDKNVRSWLMTGVRLFLYFVDAISVRLAVKKALRSDADLVVFDRYTYDELANLTLRNPFIRCYVWLIMKIVPRPHISYLLDADPVDARARKPEYPLDFLYSNRRAYLELSELIGGITVIAPMSAQEVEHAVLGHALSQLAFRDHQRNSEGATASRNRGIEEATLDGPQFRPTIP